MDGAQITTIVVTAIIAVGCVLSALALAWGSRRPTNIKPQRLDALEDRLGRVEQAIDTVAVEVERIGEAHRFTAKLLSERLEQLPSATNAEHTTSGTSG